MSKLCTSFLFFLSLATALFGAEPRPNILFVFIDDIGWGDLSCYGSPVTNKLGVPITPNLDKLAAQGIRFTQGYVAAPICSPSRTGLLTGIEPARYAIYSFLNDKANNAARNMADWLQPDTVTAPRIFQNAGYRTGQFGKWHMGGGRDVNDAPFPQAYGFDESLVAFEGMGNRVLYNNYALSTQNADVPGTIEWIEWYEGAGKHTDAALRFITNSVGAGKPFYVHVPYNDTHSPYNVPPGQENDFDHITTHTDAKTFLGELHNLDKQIGRLVAAVDGLGIATNTLIVVVGDNGAPNDTIETILNRNGGLRGGKGNLYEGGFREPFLLRFPGTAPAGTVNSTTAISTLDLLPTYCALAGIPLPNAPFAGEDMSDVLRGSTRARVRPLFWEYGTVSGLAPASPKLAVRDGNYKFMRDPEGSRRELYLIPQDHAEANNLVDQSMYSSMVTNLEARLMSWYEQNVLGNVGEAYSCDRSNFIGLVIADTCDVDGQNSSEAGFGFGTGVNYQSETRLKGAAAPSLMGYRLGGTGGTIPRQASDFTIAGNHLTVAPRNGNGRFEFSQDGVSGFNFGGFLAGCSYELSVQMNIDLVGSAYSQRLSLSLTDTSNAVIGDVDLGLQIGSDGAGGLAVFKRIDAASAGAGTDINLRLTSGLPIGTPIKLAVRVVDFNANTSDLNSVYEILVNDVLMDVGSFRFNGSTSARYLVFDVAAHEGPVHYDDLQLSVTASHSGGAVCRKPILGLSDLDLDDSREIKARLYWTAQPGLAVFPEWSGDLATWRAATNASGPLKLRTAHGTIQWLQVTETPDMGSSFFRLRKE